MVTAADLTYISKFITYLLNKVLDIFCSFCLRFFIATRLWKEHITNFKKIYKKAILFIDVWTYVRVYMIYTKKLPVHTLHNNKTPK